MKLKKLWLKFRRTLAKRRPKVGVATRRQLKKVITLQRGRWLKRSSVFFRKKYGDTLSCRPGWHQP